MEIKEYPEAIASQKFLIMAIDKQIRGAKEEVLLQKLKIREAVTMYPELKNEIQRGIKLDILLLEDQDFVEINGILNGLLDSKAQLEIQAEFLVNKFTIAKLELRERIAHIESLTDI